MLSKQCHGARLRVLPALMFGVIAVGACDDDPLDPNDPSNFGTVEVTATTTGYEPDFADYQVSLEGGGPVTLGPNGTATLVGAPAGSNTVVISTPSHCAPGAESNTVNVTAGQTATTAFTVTCEAITGGLATTYTLTGEDIDTEVSVLLDDTEVGVLDPANPGDPILHLEPGDYEATLGGVAANCTVVEESVPVTIAAGTDATAAFTINCVPNVGTLTVSFTTTGTNLDDMYMLAVGDFQPSSTGPNDDNEYTDIPVGTYDIVVSDVAENCEVQGTGANPQERVGTVAFGETTVVEFAVVCE